MNDSFWLTSTMALATTSTVDDVQVYPKSVIVGFTVIMAVIAVTMSAGNIFVIVTLVVANQIRSISVSDQLAINLCISGAIIGMFVVTYGTTTTYLRMPVWGEDMCRAMAFVKMTAIYSTNFTLSTIGIDRFLKVTNLRRHRMCFKKTWVIIAIGWVASFALALPPLFGWGYYHWVPQKPVCTNDWIHSISYTLFNVIGLISLPLCILFYCYGSIVRVVVQSRRRLDVHRLNVSSGGNARDATTEGCSQRSDSPSRRLKVPIGKEADPSSTRWAFKATKEHPHSLAISVIDVTPSDVRPHASSTNPVPPKQHDPRVKTTRHVNRADLAVIKIMIVVVSTYVVFWYPYIICMLIKVATLQRMSFVVEAVTIELAFLGMSLNPIIYAVSIKSFRKAMKSAWKKSCATYH